MHAFRAQRGLAGAAVVVVLIVVVLALVLGRSFFSHDIGLGQRGTTGSNMTRIADAVVAFAALNRRLPCPANGASASGQEVRSGSSCTNADGTVPWESLAIARELAVDGWGRKISYRVFAGAQGFTRDGGIDATNCNRDVTALATAVVDCNTTPYHTNHRDDFLLSKGLVVNDAGTVVAGVAFVLVSHGETGRGAYSAESGTPLLPPAPAGNEYLNTQGTATFQKRARNVPADVADPASYAAYFDDDLYYVRATEILAKAALDQRSWALPSSSSTATFNLAAIQAANPSYTGASQYTGLTTLTSGGATVTASAGGAAREIGFRTDSGVGGIGVIGGSSANAVISSSLNEKLTVNFGTGSWFERVDIAFNEFNDFGSNEERVEISYWRNDVQLQATVKNAWRSTNGPSNCLFTPSAGNQFDRVDIRPLTQSSGFGASSLTVSAIRACASWFVGTCATTIAGSQACP